jgi:hypothetical protein
VTNETALQRQLEWHKQAQKNDAKAKEKMKSEFDTRMNMRKTQVLLGSQVLVMQPIKNKSMSKWDPKFGSRTHAS